MTCEACTAHIQKALADVPGVQSATIDYGSRTRQTHPSGVATRFQHLGSLLNNAGTVLAVVGTGGSTRESRAKAVQAILQAKEGATVAELGSDAREKQLNGFLSGDGWYRGTEVDTLSNQEAGIIAARLVRRIQAKATHPGDKAKALQLGFADAFNRCITSKPDTLPENFLQKFNEELLKVTEANLDEQGVAAFKDALAQGCSPVSGEK
jgi:copper chaperone CopZ